VEADQAETQVVQIQEGQEVEEVLAVDKEKKGVE
jgi:hypothetical protein